MSLANYRVDDRVAVYAGDCREMLALLPDASVDAVVTDPPYDLVSVTKRFGHAAARNTPAMDTPEGSVWARKARGFMGQTWDGTGIAFDPAVWAECLRVLKPGGHLLAFGGTRTWHRLAVAIEDAGFEVRDSIAWLYGSGFPKSLDVSKAIDKAAGADRGVPRSWGANGEGHDPKGTLTGRAKATGWCEGCGRSRGSQPSNCRCDTRGDAITPDAARWQGWGTALKPAFEPVVVARKPLVGTVAANVLGFGVGALNIDGCRIAHVSDADRAESEGKNKHAQYGSAPGATNTYGTYTADHVKDYDASAGRWPANVTLDEAAAVVLDEQGGTSKSTGGKGAASGHLGYHGASGDNVGQNAGGLGDSGGASRFFYVAKAPTKERVKVDGVAHPTVKPLTLMRWLVRLVTPPGGIVVEPFAGSGTTVEAAILEGFRVVAAEMTPEYLPLVDARIDRAYLELGITVEGVA